MPPPLPPPSWALPPDPEDGPSRLPVDDASQVPLARSLATRVAVRAGLAPPRVATVALVATELAENLHRHAVGGELLLVPPAPPGRHGGGWAGPEELWLLAVDRGPGVAHFERCLADGYSTAGTLGTGLGAVVRLADRFDAVSEPGRGTVVAAAFAPAAGAATTADDADDPGPGGGPGSGGADVAGLGFPVAGEEVNGDGWAVVRRGSRVLVLLADGLGHGPGAAQASAAATTALAELADLDPVPLVHALHERLAGTRGAALTLAATDLDALHRGGAVTGVGLGNVSMLVAGPDGVTRRTPTTHGTAGSRARVAPRPQDHALPAGGAVVLHSDGLTTRWDLAGRAELLRHGALLVCAALLRDHGRGSDDSLVVVAKAAP